MYECSMETVMRSGYWKYYPLLATISIYLKNI